MTKYHRTLTAKWKRAMQKRKTAENKAVKDMTNRLLGGTDIGYQLRSGRAVWVDEHGNYLRETR